MPKKLKTKAKSVKKNKVVKLKYASFKKRFWANVIDLAILSCIGIIAYYYIFSSGNLTYDIQFSTQLVNFVSANPWNNWVFLFLVSILVLTYSSLYFLILWVAGSGQTLGYRIMEIKVIRDDGARISYPLAYLRFMSGIFSALILGMGFFYILYNKKGKTWHDYICRTSAVEE